MDEVTRALERIRSRRNVLKAGIGAALAGVGMARSAPATAAGKTGVVDIDVPACAGPNMFCATVEVENPTNGATITFGLFAKRRGGEQFRDSGELVQVHLVSGQGTYEVCFDVASFQGLLPNGRREYTALRVQAVGGAGGTFNRSVMRAKSDGVPPCGETTTTPPPGTTSPAPTTTTASPPTTTTASPATTTTGVPTSGPATTPSPTTGQPTSTSGI